MTEGESHYTTETLASSHSLEHEGRRIRACDQQQQIRGLQIQRITKEGEGGRKLTVRCCLILIPHKSWLCCPTYQALVNL